MSSIEKVLEKDDDIVKHKICNLPCVKSRDKEWGKTCWSSTLPLTAPPKHSSFTTTKNGLRIERNVIADKSVPMISPRQCHVQKVNDVWYVRDLPLLFGRCTESGGNMKVYQFCWLRCYVFYYLIKVIRCCHAILLMTLFAHWVFWRPILTPFLTSSLPFGETCYCLQRQTLSRPLNTVGCYLPDHQQRHFMDAVFRRRQRWRWSVTCRSSKGCSVECSVGVGGDRERLVWWITGIDSAFYATCTSNVIPAGFIKLPF